MGNGKLLPWELPLSVEFTIPSNGMGENSPCQGIHHPIQWDGGKLPMSGPIQWDGGKLPMSGPIQWDGGKLPMSGPIQWDGGLPWLPIVRGIYPRMGDQWVGWEEERKNQGAGAGYWVGLGCVWFRVGKEEQSVIKSSIDLFEHHIHQLISNVLLTCLILY